MAEGGGLPIEWIAAAGIVAVGSLVQASTGLGLSLVAVPVLLLLDPVYVPGPMLVNSLVLCTLVAMRERRHIDFSGLGWTTAGRLGGTVLGAGALVLLPERELTVGLGGLVLLAVGLSATNLHPRRSSAVLGGVGALSGFMGTTVTLSGPPLALAYQAEPGPRLRSTLAANMWIGGVLSLVAVASIGRLGASELRASLLLLPGLLLGFVLSGPATRLLDTGHTRRAVLVVAAAGALGVIARALQPV